MIEDLVSKAGIYINNENDNNANIISEGQHKQQAANNTAANNTSSYKRYDVVRKSRKDSLAHYPFADDDGNVADVIYKPGTTTIISSIHIIINIMTTVIN